MRTLSVNAGRQALWPRSSPTRTPWTNPDQPPAFYFATGEYTLLVDRPDAPLVMAPNQLQEAAAAGKFDGKWLVGALPFHRDDASRLFAVDDVHEIVRPLPDPGAPPSRTLSRPSGEQTVDYERRVAAAVDQIRRGHLQKVVLARCETRKYEGRLDWAKALQKLRSSQPQATAYAMQLDERGDRALIGSSPELLVSRRGDVVRCVPLAGSRAKKADESDDRVTREELLRSNKDLVEHRFLVDQLEANLAPFVAEVRVPHTPRLLATSSMWHLATPIEGRLRSPDISVLDLVLALYPTAAVGGVPHRRAVEWIERSEPFSRGFYGGALGYMDPRGDGEWIVTIRGAEVLRTSDESFEARLIAGAGIVADSVPASEARETQDKTRTIASVLDSCRFQEDSNGIV